MKTNAYPIPFDAIQTPAQARCGHARGRQAYSQETPEGLRGACRGVQCGRAYTLPSLTHETRKPDPSPAEIKRRAEAIRKGWSDREHRKRGADQRPVEALEVVPLGAV